MKRYLLTITLEDMPYACWRQVIVPGGLKLDALHLLLQQVMGWQNCHLYLFQFGSKQYREEGAMEALDTRQTAADVTIEKALGKKTSFTYEYDLGDSWMHTIRVQTVKDDFEPDRMFYCVDGKGACPPEDCGGGWGFQEMLETISNPDSEDFAEMREWAEIEDDEEVSHRWPGKFPIAKVNKWLAKIKLK
ncbi:MAG: plasmid pRiA4b ORF-3 family protein [Lentisphaeria bacterium]